MAENYAHGARVGGVTVATGTLVAVFAVISRQVPVWVALVPVGLVLAGLVLAAVYVCQTSVEVRGERLIIHRGIWRRDGEVTLAEVRRILLREVHQTAILPGSGGGVPTYKVLFIDRSGSLMQRMSGWGWSVAELQQLGTYASVPVDAAWTPVVAGRLQEEIPGSVGWFEALSTGRKILLLGALCVLGFIVAGMVKQ